MRALFMMLCVLSLTIGTTFAEGENMTNADGSFCEEGGKTPASVTTESETRDSSGVIRE